MPRHIRFPIRLLHTLLVASLLAGSLPAPTAVVAQTAHPPQPSPAPYSPTSYSHSLYPTAALTHTLFLPLVARDYVHLPTAEATLEKHVAPWLALAGDVVTYTLTVASSGAVALQGGVLVDRLPPQVEVLDAAGAQYDAGTRELRWSVGLLASGQTVSVTFRARVAAGSTMTVVQNAATFSADMLTTTITATLLVGEAVAGTLTPAGGELLSPDGLVRLVAPPGAVTQTTDVRVADFPLPEWQPGQPRWLALFDVQALGEAGQALQDGGHTRFLQPLTVTLNLRERVGWMDAYLLHFADPAGQVQQFVPSEFDRESGLLTALLQTFSGGGAAGQNPFPTDGSSFTFKTWPTADLYSGGLSYAVPINAPAGAGGLGPALSLNYSSRSLDGMMGVVQSPEVGMGWSLGGVAQIVREVKTHREGDSVGEWTNWEFRNEFTLMVGGASYRLLWGQETGAGCQYYTEERSALRVLRYNKLCRYADGSTVRPADLTNETGEYWVVTTPEGTQYRLGYTDNSEQVVPMVLYDPDRCDLFDCPWDSFMYSYRFHGYAGDHPWLVAQRWRVDQVQDTHQNTMRYGYAEMRRTTGAPIAYDRASHLAWIAYGSNERTGVPARYRVEVSLEERRDGAGNWHDDGPPSYHQYDFSLWESWRVHSIRVYAAGSLIREYVLRYETPTLEHPGTEWGQLEQPEITVLAAVQEYGRGGEALPAVTFGYAYFDQSDNDPVDGGLLGSKLRYPRLVQVGNGYGGWVAFGYERLMSDHVNSYRVTEQWQGDGLGHTAHMTYAYGEPCFAGWDVSCRRSEDRSFALLGHTWAKESAYDYSGAALVETTHTFHRQRDQALGREYRTEVRTPGVATPLQVVTSTWNVVTGSLGSTTVYTIELRASETCQGDACQGAEYEYDTYGNVVVERSLGDTRVAGDERTTRRAFAANTVAWIVSRPISETLSDAGSRAVARQYFYYDGQPAHGAAPLVGDLTRVDVWQLGGPYTMTSEYDDYGNVTAQTDALGRRATTAYDSTYHQFPTVSCSAVGTPVQQCGVTEYYGVNGPGLDAPGASFGAVYRAWGPNGPDTAATTRYDPFGRVLAVARPGDSPELPTVSYAYTPLAERVFYDDFETTCTPYSRPQGWDTFLTGIGCVQGGAYDGTWSMAADGPWGEYGQAGAVASNARFPLQPNASYRVRLALKGRGAVTFILNDGTVALTFNAAGGWQVVEGFFRTGGSTTSGQFYFALPAPRGSTAVQLDQIEVARVSGLRVMAEQRELSGCASCVHNAVQYTDGLGRVVQTRSEVAGGWSVASQEYDALGRTVRGYVPQAETGSSGVAPLRRTSPAGDFTATAYDALGRAVRVTNPDHTVVTSGYAGRTTTVTDANGHQRTSVADAYGQLVRVEEYTGTVGRGVQLNALSLYATTCYGYDALGNLTVVTDTNNVTTTMVYDDLGRKVEMFDPDMGHWTYDYDLLGNLITQTDALSQTIVFEYDELNRLVRKQVADGLVPSVLAEYRYDEDGHGYGEGQRTSMLYPGGSASYSYDTRGRVITDTRTFYLSTGTQLNAHYTYDSLDRVRVMTYPDGEVVTQTYDAGMLPATLTSSLGDPFVRGTAYNALGQIERMELGNTLSVGYAYYSARAGNSRLRQILIPGLLDLTYAYDDVGNVRAITDTVNGGQVQSFAYDPLDRLTDAWTTGGGEGAYDQQYAYDPTGNITQITHHASRVTDYEYGDPAHVHAVTGLSDGSHFEYDANGNMVLRMEISGTQMITYTQRFDVENRLTVVTATNGISQTVTRFVYDGDGARVAQVTPEGTTIYVGEYYEEFLPGMEVGSGGAGEQGSREIQLATTPLTGQYELCPYTGQIPGRQSPVPGKRGVAALAGEPMPSPLLWGGTMQVSISGDFDIRIIEAHRGCNGCARLALVSPWSEYLFSGGDVYGMQGSADSRYFSAGSYIALAFYHYQGDCSTTCASSHNPVRSDDPSEQLVVINTVGADHWIVEFDDMDIYSVQRELRVEIVRTHTLVAPTWVDSGPACTNSTDRTLTWNTTSGWWYRVQRATDAGFTQNLTSADVQATGSTASYTFGGHGTGTYYYRVQCRGGNNADPTDWITAVGAHDLSAPVTSHTLAGTLGNNGWYTSSVQVTLSAAQTGCGAAGDTRHNYDGWRLYIGPFTISANGSHTVQYYSKDSLGNTEITRSVSLKLDTIAPAASVTSSPAYDGGGSIPVGWSAADATSGVAQTRLYYRLGAGSWTYSGLSQSGTSGTFDFGPSGDGVYYFAARAQDSAGNWETQPASPEAYTTYDTTPPETTIGVPVSGTWYNNAVLPTGFSGAASDNLSGVAQVHYSLRDGTGRYWSGGDWNSTAEVWRTAGGTTAWSCTDCDDAVRSRGGGSYTLRARAADLAGNTDLSPASVLFGYDPISPTAAASDALDYTNAAWAVSAAASDTGGSGVERVRLFYRKGTSGAWTQYGGDDTSAPYTWTFTPPAGEGRYEFCARAGDRAGNWESLCDAGSGSHEEGTTYDVTPPTAAMGALPAYQTSPGFNVSWSGSDNLAGIADYDVQVSTDGGAWVNWPTNPLDTQATYSGTDGHTYAFRVRATDNAANVGGWSSPVTTEVDTTAPLIQNLSANPAIFSPNGDGRNDTTVISATIIEANPLTWQIAVLSNTQPVTSVSGTGNGVSWTWNGSGSQGDDDYTVVLTVTDAAGHSTMAQVSVWLDTAPPPAPQIKWPDDPLRTWPAGETYYSGWDSVLIHGGRDGTAAIVRVNGQAATLSTGWYSYTLSGLAPGTPTEVRVRAEDAAGNRSAAVTRTVLYDAVGPLVSDWGPQGEVGTARPRLWAAFESQGSPVVTASVAITLDGALRVTGAQITPQGFAYTPTANLSDGAHSVAVGLRDAAGNRGARTWSFDVDSATWVEIYSPPEGAVLNRLSITVTGRSEPGNTIPGGTVDAAGAFTLTHVALVSGTNVLNVTAADAWGHTAADAVTVTVNTALPAVSVSAAPNPFSPDGDGRQDETVFTLRAAPPEGLGLGGWALWVAGQPLVAGFGPPPDAIVWDGGGRPDGVYPYTLVVSATNGLAATTQAQAVVIDTAPPGVPVITTPISPTYTADVSVWVAGTAEPGSSVTLRNGGTFTFTAPVDEAGHWGRLFPLNAGWNVLRATATDPGGHESGASAPVAVQLVVEPPLIAVGITPTLASAGARLDLWATARGAGHPAGPPTRYVTATLPTGEERGLANAVPGVEGLWSGHYTVTQALENGLHAVEYLGVDQVGLKGTGRTALWVDWTEPAPPWLMWPQGSGTTREPGLTVSGAAEPLARLGVHVGATVTATAADANGEWSIPARLAEGENRIWAEAWDLVGNRSAPSASARRTLDTLSPTVALTTRPFVRAGSGLTVSAAIGDAGPIAQALLSLPDVVGVGEMVLTEQGGAWQTTCYLPVGAVEGSHTARVRAWDGAGNMGQADRLFTVDNTRPQIALSGIAESSPYAYIGGGVQLNALYYGVGNGAFTVTVAATDTLAGLESVAFPAATSPGAAYRQTGVLSATAYHVYTFTAATAFGGAAFITATDRADNARSEVFTVTRDAAPPQAQATQSPQYANASPVGVQWTASDSASGVQSTALWVRFESGAWQQSALAAQPGVAGRFDFACAQEGRYEFGVVSADNVGNVEAPPSGAGEAATIYDVTPPTATLAALPQYQTTRAFAVAWSGVDPTPASGRPAGIASYDVQVATDGGTWARKGARTGFACVRTTRLGTWARGGERSAAP